MVLAISLIKVVPDHEKIVYHALKDVEGVKSLYHIFGEHDFFMTIEASDMSNLEKVLEHIKEMCYVGSIRSILVAPTIRCATNKINTKNFLTIAA
jgi:DNA-binding Lrp family transcriptional regulator